MDAFFEQFDDLIETTRSSGIRAVPSIADGFKQGEVTEDLAHTFIASCHRGFAESQRKIVRLLEDVLEDGSLDTHERNRRVMLLRRVADHIAWTLFAAQDHLLRRFSLHERPPAIDLPVIREALERAEQMNAESELCFALLGDLTSFIHIADIVRIDFREAAPRASFIELKSGKVNEILLERLGNYEPSLESIDRLESDPQIDTRYLKQAKRMMRQRVRLAQVEEIRINDRGTDIRFQKPLQIVEFEKPIETYDEYLVSLCREACARGRSGVVVNFCIHLSAVAGEDKSALTSEAHKALNQAIRIQRGQNPPGIGKLADQLRTDEGIDIEDQFFVYNLLRLNLGMIESKPFTLWSIPSEYLSRICRGTLLVVGAFDLPAFLWLARSEGASYYFLTRRETGRLISEYGSKAFPRWNGRAIAQSTPSGPEVFGGGMLRRFLSDLESPASFLEANRSHEAEEVTE